MNCNTRAIKSISTLTHSELTQMNYLVLDDIQRRGRGGNILKLVCGCLVNRLSAFSTEFQRIAMATAIGFAIMGFIGFFVKLIHIPINNIIVYVPPFLSLSPGLMQLHPSIVLPLLPVLLCLRQDRVKVKGVVPLPLHIVLASNGYLTLSCVHSYNR